ncbi:MAG: ABC transporter permease [Alphaproteobacteria bacterium]|nr:ABC transporter permease [Alphaproteobacteria bacterium]MDD9920640.1 ABC transporter permease [Alphaproteobacteria bacterium]
MLFWLNTSYALIQRLFLTWVKNWKNFIMLRIAEPTITLYGMGFGLSLAFNQVNGVPYLNYVVPGIMCSGLMFGCILDGIYGSLTRELYQGTWKSQLTANINLRQILLVEAFWVGFKGACAAIIVMWVGFFFGGVQSPFVALLTFPFLLLGGIALTSFGQIFAATAYSYTDVEYLWPLIITPMFLFSGTFIPLESFPQWLQFISTFLPLTYIIELVRGTLLTTLTIEITVLNSLLLVALTVVSQTISHHLYHKRLFT